MAFKATQVTVTATSTAVSALAGYTNTGGTVTDPIPILITNTDTTNYLYVGGVGVTDATGTPIYPQTSQALNCYGPSEIPYIYSPVGNIVVAILVGRQ